ncbi:MULTISPECIES: hypothetical protein [Mesorhizobium]|uniref:hypothetical protein n=1 Tax=Mesorhizobium TaxID=68287 RepID=UPI0007FB7C82|nr:MULTISPECIES: hypothetical protein [Mesorhizobium]OBQ92035.1 hypothetical protein A9K66_07955 [Mesorhizobium sp. AA23]
MLPRRFANLRVACAAVRVSDADLEARWAFTVAFFEGGKPLEARYAGDGDEILTYKKANRMCVDFRFGVALASLTLVG